MKNRILLKEIPGGKFHSAIFTTYSINLYYLEQQVLPLLGAKGIHYVSILADGAMLSSHLENFGYLSQQRKRNYAVHGIQSAGAFHPKLIFLAGTDSVLLLVGSGNLTTSGHGKNLEVWNAVYINSMDDTRYGFVIQAWNYLKYLHADLGESANNKLKSIEENCFLLSKGSPAASAIFPLDEQNQISFHANQADKSLFQQVSDIIQDDQIERITIMCPFHDSEGRFIQELNNRFKPNQIDVLIQADFGSLPLKMVSQTNVSFYQWTDVIREKQRQSYFHAKNIVFKGSNKNYLISGSANASIAAFGTMTIPAINQESCVVYQSSNRDYLELLSLDLTSKTVNLKDYKTARNANASESSGLEQSIFIKSAERNFDTVSLIFGAKYSIKRGFLILLDSKGEKQYEEIISLEPGDHCKQLSIPNGISLLLAFVSVQGQEASNKQFVTDINAFESTNPSPRNRSLNQIRKLIESGNFSTPKIIDYLNTIYRQKEENKGVTKGSLREDRNDEIPIEQDDDLLYLSYAEIHERAKQIDSQEKIHHYIEYKGVRLWESIFSYLKENREKELQDKIDEEETEDINSSDGRSDKNEHKQKNGISKSNYERLKEKVEKFLASYNEILRQKTVDSKSEQPSLIDLSMYLIMMEILLHLFGHKETITEDKTEQHLLKLPLSKALKSWSNYLIQFIGLFTMWCNQKNGFKDLDSTEYRMKLKQFKSMAFKTNLCALAIYNNINQSYDHKLRKQWLILSLLNSDQTFNSAKTYHIDYEEIMSFFPQNVREQVGEAILEEEISKNVDRTRSIERKHDNFLFGDYYYHTQIGYTYLSKVIQNPTNTYYKLFTPAFEWDESLNNFWNGQVYSVKEKRWLKLLS